MFRSSEDFEFKIAGFAFCKEQLMAFKLSAGAKCLVSARAWCKRHRANLMPLRTGLEISLQGNATGCRCGWPGQRCLKKVAPLGGDCFAAIVLTVLISNQNIMVLSNHHGASSNETRELLKHGFRIFSIVDVCSS